VHINRLMAAVAVYQAVQPYLTAVTANDFGFPASAEDILQYEVPDEAEWLERQIDTFKRELADTDYHILKVVEGVKSLAECAEVMLKRKGWRSKINELEARLAKLKGGAS